MAEFLGLIVGGPKRGAGKDHFGREMAGRIGKGRKTVKPRPSHHIKVAFRLEHRRRAARFYAMERSISPGIV
jgi:hypothetical protein